MGLRRVYQTMYPYFITSRVDDGVYYFLSEKRAKVVYENIVFYKQKYNITLFSFIIMPDHFHVLLKQQDLSKNISKFMEGVKFYTQKTLRKSEICGISGSIWQKSFHYQIIRDNNGFHNTLKYIKNNPMKAELIEEKFLKSPYFYINENAIKSQYNNYAMDGSEEHRGLRT